MNFTLEGLIINCQNNTRRFRMTWNDVITGGGQDKLAEFCAKSHKPLHLKITQDNESLKENPTKLIV